jgi:hypothetical protein
LRHHATQLKIQFHLGRFKNLLLAGTSADRRFIEFNRADTISGRPEMHNRYPTMPEQSPVDQHRAFTLQKENYKRNAKLGGNPQTHVDMVGHQVAIQ